MPRINKWSWREMTLSAVPAVTSWLEQNRPEHESYMRYATYDVVVRGETAQVTISVDGPRGYKYYTFKVEFGDETKVQLMSEHT